METGRFLISCPDRPGIVAGVSRLLYEEGANIMQLNQHSTGLGEDEFFMRVEFELDGLEERRSMIESRFGGVAEDFSMDWKLTNAAYRKRLVVFVSRADHALLELLWQQRAGDISADIVAVVSNHDSLRQTVEGWGIPYHHVPVQRDSRDGAEAEQLRLVADYRGDAIVLARYMQVLSPAFLASVAVRIINIHHSFLPAFVGANPYAAAHERGVKLIGATAHYVSEELDAGPIIEQDVQRVDHRHTPGELRAMGRYIERVVLARAVRWHAEDRVLLHGRRTIVFS